MERITKQSAVASTSLPASKDIAMANTIGSGKYTYELVERWGTLPSGWTFGPVSAIATDSQDRVYAFQRKDPPVIIFDRRANYLGSWGQSAITDPHGFLSRTMSCT
jgi:hypothetical protein